MVKYFKFAAAIVKSDASDNILFNGEFLKSAGTTDCDWYAIALGRTGAEDDYFSFISVLKNKIKKDFFENGKRKKGIKATDFQRTVLALLSVGGNPYDDDIRLIDKGICDFSLEELGRQGLNAYIWELIALDSMNYKIPESCTLTRKSIITEILKYQRSDGAFYHKLTKDHFAPFIMPQDDTDPEYLIPVSHCATAAAAACAALSHGSKLITKFMFIFIQILVMILYI